MKEKIAITIFILFSFLNIVFAQDKGDLRIEVEGLRNSAGIVSIALFNSEMGFPEESEKALKLEIAEIMNGKAVFSFRNLPTGNYAFAILHDENKDGEMKKNLIGIPKEGFAFSQNFKPTMGAPDFDEASFKLSTGSNRVDVQMIYYL